MIVRNIFAPAQQVPLDVADDEQRWVLQSQDVLLELGERRVGIGALGLVFDGEMATLPHVRPAAATRGLGDTLLEAVGCGVVRLGLPQERAEIAEMFLIALPLVTLPTGPLRDEGLDGRRDVRHGHEIFRHLPSVNGRTP